MDRFGVSVSEGDSGAQRRGPIHTISSFVEPVFFDNNEASQPTFSPVELGERFAEKRSLSIFVPDQSKVPAQLGRD